MKNTCFAHGFSKGFLSDFLFARHTVKVHSHSIFSPTLYYVSLLLTVHQKKKKVQYNELIVFMLYCKTVLPPLRCDGFKVRNRFGCIARFKSGLRCKQGRSQGPVLQAAERTEGDPWNAVANGPTGKQSTSNYPLPFNPLTHTWPHPMLGTALRVREGSTV